MGNDMLTPSEYNNKYFRELNERKGRIEHTGIKCPKCGKEMIYGGDMILTTNPPQRYIYCLPCNYSTTIYC